MKNLLITMSGGTTSVINSTLAGILRAAQDCSFINKIYAGFPGIVGFIDGKVLDLTNLSEKELQILRTSPGSASIGTTRTKIFDEGDLDSIRSRFEEYNIGYFINIGGNGTIKQTKFIAKHIKNVFVASAPKTVDNDLGDKEFEDLLYTPGFPSCINYWFHKMHMLNNENRGACTNDKVLITQTFGRETGFIVGSMRMFDVNRESPLVLLIPEDQQSPDKVIAKIDETVSKFDRAIVGICEGYKISDYRHVLDQTGQTMYGSSESTAMQQLINLCNHNNIQARGFNPTVDQRQNFNFTLDKDLEISYNIGKEIILNFMNNKTHFFQSYTKDREYKSIPLESIHDYSRKMLSEWVDYGNFDVTEKYVDYIKEFTSVSPNRKLFVFGGIH